MTCLGRRAWRVATALLFCIIFSGCVTTVRKHPDFAERRAKISSVAVVPPEVEIVRVVFRGDNEPLTEEEEAISLRLPDLLATKLRERGLTVKESRLDKEHFEKDSELRFETTQIKDAFARAMKETYEKKEMWKSKARKYERSLGPDVNRFADHADVDALIFARMHGFKKSSGEKARDVIMAVALGVALGGAYVEPAPGKGASLQVAIVDGTAGDVLWANMVDTTGDFEGSGLKSMVKKLFKPFPR